MSNLISRLWKGAGQILQKGKPGPSVFEVPNDWEVKGYDSGYMGNLFSLVKGKWPATDAKGGSGGAASSAARKEPVVTTVTWRNLTWVNMERPTRRELDSLAQNYPFHPLDLDDCLSKVQLPKIDEYESYLFTILHFPVFEHRTRITSPGQLAIFLGKEFVVTVHSGELKPLVNLPVNCQQNSKTCEEYLGKDSGYFLYRIVDMLVDYCFPMVNKTFYNLDAIEDRVFDDKITVSHEIATLRRDIASQRRIIGILRSVVADLERKAQRYTEVDLKVYFGDINDHIARLWSNLDECNETIEIYKDTDFTMGQERTNRILAILTIVFTVSIPFTVIASLYGMNVRLPGGTETGAWTAWGSYTTFIIVLLVAGLPTLLMLWLFRRWRWL
ncbi:MAG: magnesium transporter CorA family protein [Chloroflexi bacterium]|nr:magnesium transporter CorA family protein [Chloroflexota bacterium]